MLGNGLCTRPVELECRMESACETCAYFQTGPEFVPVLLRQRDHARDHHQPDRAALFDRPPRQHRRRHTMRLMPRADHDTEGLIDRAAESLATLRGLPCPDDPGVRMHALASLAQQIHTSLLHTISDARQLDYTWDEIAEFTDTTQTQPIPTTQLGS